MSDDREPRDNVTRETRKRKVSWKPSSLLPEPRKLKGFRHKWVRTGSVGTSDSANVSAKFREGYEPVNATEYPELRLVPDERSRFPDKVEIGGLLLCKIPEETVEARSEYMAKKARAQIESVDNHYMQDSDRRAPLAKPQRTTRVKFGASARED